MNPFDQIIKSKLEQVNPVYSDLAWAKFEKNLSGAKSGGFNKPLIGGVAASVVLLSIMGIGNHFDPPSYPIEKPIHQNFNEPAIGTIQEPTPGFTNGLDKGAEIVSGKITPIPSQYESSTDVEENPEPAKETALGGTNATEENKSYTSIDAGQSADPGPTLTPTHATALHIVTKGKACLNSTVVFSVKNPSPDQEYNWEINGKTHQGISAQASFSKPGKYQVQLNSYEGRAKTGSTVSEITIEDPLQPVVNFDAKPKENCFGAEIFLSTATPSPQIDWYVNNQLVGTGNSINLDVMEPKVHTQVSVTSSNGCTYTNSLTREIPNVLEILAGNSFSPNGDMNNDTWFPPVVSEHKMNSRLEIRNMRGQKVYETSTGKPWDGAINGTVEVAREGEQFQWIMVATDQCGQTVEKTGTLTILP